MEICWTVAAILNLFISCYFWNIFNKFRSRETYHDICSDASSKILFPYSEKFDLMGIYWILNSKNKYLSLSYFFFNIHFLKGVNYEKTLLGVGKRKRANMSEGGDWFGSIPRYLILQHKYKNSSIINMILGSCV